MGSSSIEWPTLLYLPLISLLQMRTCDLKLYRWKDFSHYTASPGRSVKNNYNFWIFCLSWRKSGPAVVVRACLLQNLQSFPHDVLTLGEDCLRCPHLVQPLNNSFRLSQQFQGPPLISIANRVVHGRPEHITHIGKQEINTAQTNAKLCRSFFRHLSLHRAELGQPSPQDALAGLRPWNLG